MVEVPDLSIVIVNWNSREFLRKCLVSVLEGASHTSREIIVVDNASYDGCEEMLHSEFPSVHFIQAGKNLGFAKANNLGFRHSTGRNLLFLNPDTEILESSLAGMVSFLDGREGAGVVGPKLLNSDLTVQMESIRAFPSLVNQALDSSYLKARLPRLSIWGMRPLFDESSEPVPVDVVSGACLMIKRQVFEHVGGFTTRYFMYSEDVDLCHKVKESRWKTYFLGSAVVLHHGGQSSALKPVSQFASVLMRESRFQFLRMARGNLYAFAFRLMTGASAVCRIVVLIFLFPLLGRLRGATVLQAVGKWVKILRWSLGFEHWVEHPK